MVSDGNSSAAAVRLTDRPVLLEGPGAFDGGLIRAGSLENIVRRSVRGDRALARGAGGGVKSAKAFDDVVLDERIGGPAVDGEVTVAIGAVGAAEGDCPGMEMVW